VFTGWNIWERAPLSAHLVLERLLAAIRPEAAPRGGIGKRRR
jgi:hypothetical protein